ncbi:MAG TPA: FHA domain-containing protein [Polyangiales bacterium]|nr:FHA domain-containing protein [Polyangiales bacterium]
MIVCTRCSKENQDHYKFCLGCGSELPRDSASKGSSALAVQAPTAAPPAPAPAMESAVAYDRQPPGGDKSLEFARTHQGEVSEPPRPGPAANARPAGGAPAGGVAMNPSGGAGPNSCPACGNPVPMDFKFCGTCGHRMSGAGGGAAAAVPAASPRQAAPVAQTGGRTARGALVVINPDGTEGGTFQLSDGATIVGRSHGAPFSADAYLSPTHATFTFQGSNCTVKDESSLNGVYVKLKRDSPVKLGDGDVFRIGQELIRFNVLSAPQLVEGVEPMGSPNPGYVGRIALVIGRESYGNGYPVPPDGIHLGRERGDVIFPEDGYVSGLHCRIHYDGANCVLTDVGSSNGTFVRVRGSRAVVSGDLLLMGQQLFRLQF